MISDASAATLEAAQAYKADLTDPAARVAVITVDAQNRVTHFNRGAQKMFGISPLEVNGRLISEFIDNDKLVAMLSRHGRISEGPVCLRGLDLWASLVPLCRDHGGMMVVLVPELREEAWDYDEALQEELSSLLENSYDGIVVADKDCIRKVNPSFGRITGLPPSFLINKKIQELDKGRHVCLAAVKEVIRLARYHKKTITLQKRIKSGNEIFLTCCPVLNRHGQVDRVVLNVRDITELKGLENQIKKLSGLRLNREDAANQSEAFKEIVAESSAMQNLLQLVMRVSQVNSTVLLMGESGVGKDVIAHMIHRLSERSDGPFISVNCGAVPENLLESEFFGYEKGAFTSASRSGKPGLFEQANGGTFFLDEVGELPLNLQVKLLKVIQDQHCRRLGGQRNIKLDIRFIAATNRDMRQMVAEGKFRDDLFYRLYVVPIEIAPLRERREDILPLALMFLKELISDKYDVNRTLSHDLMTILESYDWPGNVRELQNVIERMVVTADSEVLQPRHLPDSVYQQAAQKGLGVWVGGSLNLRQARDDLERQLITKALSKTGNTRKAAKLLGVDHSTVVRKSQKLGLDLKAAASGGS